MLITIMTSIIDADAKAKQQTVQISPDSFSQYFWFGFTYNGIILNSSLQCLLDQICDQTVRFQYFLQDCAFYITMFLMTPKICNCGNKIRMIVIEFQIRISYSFKFIETVQFLFCNILEVVANLAKRS